MHTIVLHQLDQRRFAFSIVSAILRASGLGSFFINDSFLFTQWFHTKKSKSGIRTNVMVQSQLTSTPYIGSPYLIIMAIPIAATTSKPRRRSLRRLRIALPPLHALNIAQVFRLIYF